MTTSTKEYKFEGSKYRETRDLSNKEIIAMIRKEIRSKYPSRDGYKISVRLEHYTAINVDVLETPFEVETEDFKRYKQGDMRLPFTDWLRGEGIYYDYKQQHIGYGTTDEAHELEEDLKAIGSQYNMDDSDSMTDYFHNRFYYFVRIK